MNQFLPKCNILAALLFSCVIGQAQHLLQKKVSVQAVQQRLNNVLEIIGNQGGFNFSYNSNSIKRDSVVTLQVNNKPVQDVLNTLLGADFEYIESGNYLIIRRKPINVTNKPVPAEDKSFYISGVVYDGSTGEKLSSVSVYEGTRLSSDLTDENGTYKLKVKATKKKVVITITKLFYADTTIVIDRHMAQVLNVSLRPKIVSVSTIAMEPKSLTLPDTLTLKLSNGDMAQYAKINNDVAIQKSWMAKFLISSKQKIQSVNLSRFFTTRNFQVSFVPGLSSQGRMSSLVSNKFSLNVLGGYTGSVSAVEIAGLFNINKKNVKGFQAAGLLNAVGGKVLGVQAAGIHNLVLDSVHGLQVGGISNYTKSNVLGVQVAGIYNHTKKEVRGAQVSGIVNYAKKVKGLQIGLINIADTVDGVQIGLINIAKNGYRKWSVTTDELSVLKMGVKMGAKKLYSIVELGAALNADKKLFSIGYGIGRENKLNSKLSLNTEYTSSFAYKGNWNYTTTQQKFAFLLQAHLGKTVGLLLGPTFTINSSKQPAAVPGYAFDLPTNSFKLGTSTKGWIGFTAGLQLF